MRVTLAGLCGSGKSVCVFVMKAFGEMNVRVREREGPSEEQGGTEG